MTSELMRCLPPVDAVLGRPVLAEALRTWRRDYLVRWIGAILDDLRREIRREKFGPETSRDDFLAVVESRLLARISRLETQGLTNVINAAGVVIHTNLGRSPLAGPVLQRMAEMLKGYTDIEYDIAPDQ